MRDDTARLQDILRAIDQIHAKSSGGREAFAADEMVQVWVLHHLQIMGEATRCLSDSFRQRHPDAVWSEATGLRHILVHHYFEIQPERIWAVVAGDLPQLREIVSRALSEPAAES